MWRGILKRLFSIIPTLLIGITFCYLLITLAPGDPSVRFISPTQAPDVQETIRERFGLNQPVIFQYLHWLKRVVFHLDFGYSFYSGQPCIKVLRNSFIPTLVLSFWALLIALIIGTSTGVIAATHSGKRADKWISGMMMILISIPGFWLGLLLIGFFSIRLDWLPSSHLHSLYYDQLDGFARYMDSIKHLVLPVCTLALPLSATIFKYFRAKMIEVLHADYILAGRAMGLRQSVILWKYALKNSLMPIISLLGVIIPSLLSGAVVIEVLFALPGIGRMLVTAVFSRDYPLIMASTTLTFFLVVFFNWVADLGYAFIDPRVRDGLR